MEKSRYINMVMQCEQLINRYLKNKESPESIAISAKVSGRTIRNWLKKCGCVRLGASHLRSGKSATWSIGVSRTAWNKGRKSDCDAWNKGHGTIRGCCSVCSKTFFDKPYRRSKYCSSACRDSLRGTAHWNFKGSQKRGSQTRRCWVQYKEWKKAVHTRDGARCKLCGKVGTIAHHLDGWAKNPDLRFEVSNGITVCYACHREIHTLCGQRNYSLAKFLNIYSYCTATNTWKRVAISTW